MLTAPKTSSMLLTSVASVVNTFVKLRQVDGDVVCLESGRKDFDYRGILRVKTINFSQMPEDEQQSVIEGFKGFLNTISFPIQILIRNRSYDPEHYLQMLPSGEGLQSPMTRDHAKFVRALASRRGLVTREFYMIIPADHQPVRNKTEAFFNAQVQLKQRIEEISYQLESVGLTGKRLTTLEIVQLYQSCYAPWEEPFPEGMREKSYGGPQSSLREVERFPDDYQELAAHALEIQRQKRQKAQNEKKEAKALAKKNKMPKFIKIPGLILPNTIHVSPSYMRIKREGQQEFVRTLALTSYPHSIHSGWFGNIIQVNEPNIDFSIQVNPLPRKPVNSYLAQKALQFRGANLVSVRQGRTPDPSITRALGDVEKLRENIMHDDEQAFTISVFIQVRGRDRRELGERSDRVARTIRSVNCRALPTHWQHHIGLMSCLPDANNPIGRGRLFGASSAATFYPFINSDISMETGVMFGAHPSGSLIVVNPFNRKVLENSNLLVFAKAGVGKSFFLKTVTSRLLPTCNVYTIDSQGEYDALREVARGQSVHLTPDSLQINPFEFHGGVGTTLLSETSSKGEANFFREKLLYLTTLLELMLSDEGTLLQKEKAVLYKCLILAYEKRGIGADPATHGHIPPTMHDFYDILSRVLRNDDRLGIGQGLSERLERHLQLFPARTQVVLDNRFIDFNMHALDDTFKPIGTFLVAEFLWTRLRQMGRQSNGSLPRTLLLIDEVWPLMKFQQGAKFLEDLARRLPGYGSGLWCSTQYTVDFLTTEEGQTILSMSAMKFLMKQDANTIDPVAQAFHLNPGQKSFLLGARRGEGLFTAKNWSQMEVLASPLEAKMASAPPTLPAAFTQTHQLSINPGQNQQETVLYENEGVRLATDERKRSEIR